MNTIKTTKIINLSNDSCNTVNVVWMRRGRLPTWTVRNRMNEVWPTLRLPIIRWKTCPEKCYFDRVFNIGIPLAHNRYRHHGRQRTTGSRKRPHGHLGVLRTKNKTYNNFLEIEHSFMVAYLINVRGESDQYRRHVTSRRADNEVTAVTGAPFDCQVHCPSFA